MGKLKNKLEIWNEEYRILQIFKKIKSLDLGFGFFFFFLVIWQGRKSTKIPSLFKNIPSITCEFFHCWLKVNITKVPWGLFLSLFLPCPTFHKIKERSSVSSYPPPIPFLKDKRSSCWAIFNSQPTLGISEKKT